LSWLKAGRKPGRKPGFRPGFRPARVMECGLYLQFPGADSMLSPKITTTYPSPQWLVGSTPLLQMMFCLVCTWWLKIKYPTRHYSISLQPVVWFKKKKKLLKLFNPDTSLTHLLCALFVALLVLWSYSALGCKNVNKDQYLYVSNLQIPANFSKQNL